jgi:DNA helicase IV
LQLTRSVPAAAVDTVRERLRQEGSIGVIAAAADLAVITRSLTKAAIPHGRVEDGMDSRVELVPVTLCKGLEFDHVIVAEPAAVVRSEDRGLHWLYVALTRAVSSLDVVYAEPLPVELMAS